MENGGAWKYSEKRKQHIEELRKKKTKKTVMFRKIWKKAPDKTHTNPHYSGHFDHINNFRFYPKSNKKPMKNFKQKKWHQIFNFKR